MCPSWKGTRERRHSPKGRAQLMREWLRQLAARGVDPVAEAAGCAAARAGAASRARFRNSLARRRGERDFSHEVKEAMDGCLACKSCVGQCPIKVDVPAFRSKFLELYYGRYLRPLRDYVGRLARAPLPADGADAAARQRACRRGPGPAGSARRSGSSTRRLVGRRSRGASCERACAHGRRRTPCEPRREQSAPQRRRRAGRLHQLLRDASSSSTCSTCAGARLPALAGAVPAQRQAAARAWLPRRFRAHRGGERGDAAGPCGDGRRPYRPRPVDDPDLPRRNMPGAARAATLPTVLLVQEWLASASRCAAARRRKARTICCCPTAPSAPPRSGRGSRLAAGLRTAAVSSSTILPSGCCGMAGT